MKNTNTRTVSELEELKKYAEKRKLEWDQIKKDRKGLEFKNMANARSVQCQDFVVEINKLIEKSNKKNSICSNAKPIMLGFIAAMLLNKTFQLIEAIIIKIALIIK